MVERYFFSMVHVLVVQSRQRRVVRVCPRTHLVKRHDPRATACCARMYQQNPHRREAASVDRGVDDTFSTFSNDTSFGVTCTVLSTKSSSTMFRHLG